MILGQAGSWQRKAIWPVMALLSVLMALTSSALLPALHAAPALPQSISPGLLLGTVIGGSEQDFINDMAVDAAGNYYLVGSTTSTDLPAARNAPASAGLQNTQAFLIKVSSAGVVQYTLYFSGSQNDWINAVAVDKQGNIWLTGGTQSINFPEVDPFPDPWKLAGPDAFVARLNPDGTLAFSTSFNARLALNSRAEGQDIALDSDGNAYVTGRLGDALVMRFNAGSNRVASSFGSQIYQTDVDSMHIALDSQRNIYLAGTITNSAIEPVQPVQASCGAKTEGGCTTDVFVIKLNTSMDNILFSSYLGGGGSGYEGTEWIGGLSVDGQGRIYLSGSTDSATFPTHKAIQSQRKGSSDGFITRLKPQGQGYSFDYSSYLGGSSTDEGNALTVDTIGTVYLAGTTWSKDFPLHNPFQTSAGAGICTAYQQRCSDTTITRIAPDGQISFSTYLGGGNSDQGRGIQLLGQSIGVAGNTDSDNFPYTVSSTGRASGAEELFLTVLDPNKAPTSTPGTPTTVTFTPTAPASTTGIPATTVTPTTTTVLPGMPRHVYLPLARK